MLLDKMDMRSQRLADPVLFILHPNALKSEIEAELDIRTERLPSGARCIASLGTLG